VAPEVFKQEEYDTKVDVFSFALILQEVTIFIVSSTLVKATHYKIFMEMLSLLLLLWCIYFVVSIYMRPFLTTSWI